MNPPLANQPFLEGNGYSSWSLALRPDFSSVCVYVAFTSKMFEFPPSTKTSPMTFCLDKTPHISSHARSETPCGSAQKLARSNLGEGITSAVIVIVPGTLSHIQSFSSIEPSGRCLFSIFSPFRWAPLLHESGWKKSFHTRIGGNPSRFLHPEFHATNTARDLFRTNVLLNAGNVFDSSSTKWAVTTFKPRRHEDWNPKWFLTLSIEDY